MLAAAATGVLVVIDGASTARNEAGIAASRAARESVAAVPNRAAALAPAPLPAAEPPVPPQPAAVAPAFEAPPVTDAPPDPLPTAAPAPAEAPEPPAAAVATAPEPAAEPSLPPQPAPEPPAPVRQAAPPAPSDAAAPPEPTAPAAEPTLAGYLQARENAPLECLPAELRTVLADVAARFGAVAVVSTDRLNTDNHSPGSAREKMHQACRAVDFRPEPGRVDEIKAYLRSRREIGGVESYRNGVVHVDLAAAPRPRAQAPRPAEPDPVETTASAPAAPNPFAAVEPPDIVR